MADNYTDTSGTSYYAPITPYFPPLPHCPYCTPKCPCCGRPYYGAFPIWQWTPPYSPTVTTCAAH